MVYDRAWKQINYEAMTSYLDVIKAKASIVKPISYWAAKPGETKLATYIDYIGKLLNKIADELKAKTTEETTILIIPARFLPVLYFGPFERTEPTAICGPYFAGVVCHSASVIVDINCHNEFFAYNINNPEKVLKLEIQE